MAPTDQILAECAAVTGTLTRSAEGLIAQGRPFTACSSRLAVDTIQFLVSEILARDALNSTPASKTTPKTEE
jgi:hypothetical protein